MKTKAIFLDIDGTIYNEDKQMSDVTVSAVRALQEKGHHVLIATGRSPFMYTSLMEKLGIISHIGFNGSYVVIDGDVVLAKSLHSSALENIFEMAHRNDHAMVFMDHTGMRTDQLSHPRIKECMESLLLPYPPIHKNPMDGEVYQALLFSTKGENPSDYEHAFSEFDFVRWHDLSVDIVPAGGSKAVGIQKAADLLNIPMEDTIAFGDGLNDIEMLQAAGVGVAMGNGTEQTKQAADFITKSVDEEGIHAGLKELGLI